MIYMADEIRDELATFLTTNNAKYLDVATKYSVAKATLSALESLQETFIEFIANNEP